MLTDRDKMELRYLAKQKGPIWAGVRASGSMPEDMRRWKAAGLIAESGDGYVITTEGRKACGADLPRCQSCGREF